jgi:hypothetical protein
MAGVLSEIFSSTLNGLVSAALVLAAVAEMDKATYRRFAPGPRPKRNKPQAPSGLPEA